MGSYVLYFIGLVVGFTPWEFPTRMKFCFVFAECAVAINNQVVSKLSYDNIILRGLI